MFAVCKAKQKMAKLKKNWLPYDGYIQLNVVNAFLIFMWIRKFASVT